ncbi:MAG TPA: hypothetical protein VGY90_08295, partial [Steroidobacteraceae bacterium]|nr:hypothetical protein [Steroidobacteraceae bacterium]
MSLARKNLIRRAATSVAVLCSLLAPVVANAQQTEQAALQEVVVTATKRVESIQAVPFSVSATSQQQIINSGADNIVELA